MADDPKYNWIYTELVKGPDDIPGALAYVLYKQEKIAYIESLTVENEKPPSDDELLAFHRMTNLPQRLESYREQADGLLEDFLEVMLADRLLIAQEAFKTSHVSTLIRDTESDIRGHITSTESIIKAEISKVQTSVNSRKGFSGWSKDLGTNFLVNVFTVVVIGLAVVGLGAFDTLSSLVKNGISAVAKLPPTESLPQNKSAKE